MIHVTKLSVDGKLGLSGKLVRAVKKRKLDMTSEPPQMAVAVEPKLSQPPPANPWLKSSATKIQKDCQKLDEVEYPLLCDS